MSDKSEQKRKYRKHSLPDPRDVTLDSVAIPSDPAFVRYVGELLYGDAWQVPLAAALSEVRGKRLAPAMLHQYLMQARPWPEWLGDALAAVLERGASDLQRRASVARDVAARLRTPLTPEEAMDMSEHLWSMSDDPEGLR